LPQINLHLRQTQDYLIATTSAVIRKETCTELVGEMPAPIDANDIGLIASRRKRLLRIVVPLTTPQPFYYARNNEGCVFGDDLRLFPLLRQTELDERAIFSLFQYGAITPPFTIYKDVHRLPNGHIFELPFDYFRPKCSPFFLPTTPRMNDEPRSQPEIIVEQTLREVLSELPSPAVLYFSGGVDSALLASELVKLGRSDIDLINYSFGPEDTESSLAVQIASQLGLECHQVTHDSTETSAMLSRLGKDYSFPFGDFSAVPMNILVNESLRHKNGACSVIEGTGADGAFGLAATFADKQRIYAVPSSLRRLVRTAYRLLSLWKYSSKAERIAGFMSKSVDMSLGPAVVAPNPLEGIAYKTPNFICTELNEAIVTNLQVLGQHASPSEQLSLLDLVWVCAGVMAAKSFDPLRRRGFRPFYPFLEFPMVCLSAALSPEEKYEAGEAKAPLKKLLAQTIPSHLVYRSKSGFTPPYRQMFASSEFQEFLRGTVLSARNPVIDFCQPKNVRAMVDRASRNQSLSFGACDFLWALTFTSGWLQQLPDATELKNDRPQILPIAFPSSEDARLQMSATVQ
jgi:asparagine synthase (glutamine-hydrolysing)